ncbi:MAG: cytochrome D ubiquinol oxidase subunit I [Thermodesulfovibrio sp. RBG_19FT_COMBO_42_12]|nr:MAG: cytochrome D ubiquinol oxidase subunit I [Thermodesulfovibrio sp. RBG_19FT_COMBO_42_12]HZX48965.1 cytochrome ubiquinol oxidase subunit I [Nitrospirota bacterium]
MDVVLLSRLQFFLTISFHFVFVSISIGLAWWLVVIELLGWRRRNGVVYLEAAKFFSKLFAITFVTGTATGIVMEFQIGMNWAEYSKFSGDVFGPLLAAEGLIAFFTEASFLGLYLFGRNKVSRTIHFLSIFMVAAASTISAFWILAANSWQQTPAGFVIKNGRVVLTDFSEVIFNPSTLQRYFHTVDATLITGTFFVSGISSYLLLRNMKIDAAAKLLRYSLIAGLILSVLQVVPFGHEHARQVALTQPEKFAVLEAVEETQSYAPFVLFGIPMNGQSELKWAVKIPGLLSLITFGDASATIKGVKDFPQDELPPRFIPFFAFRSMVILGMYFIVITLYGVIKLYRGRLFNAKKFLRLLVWSLPLPIIASQLGWIAAEVGRQPWIIYKVMKTAEGATTNLPASNVLFTLIMFVILYALIGGLYVFLIRREINKWI